MLTRIASTTRAPCATLEASARAVTELAAHGLMAMVEPFLSHARGRPGASTCSTPTATIKSIHVAAGLGASSAHTWLKLPVVDDLERVMDATTLPTLLLGGDPQGDPDDTYAAWGRALELPAGARPRRRSRPALPAGRRRRRRRRHRRRAASHGGAAMSDARRHRVTCRWVRRSPRRRGRAPSTSPTPSPAGSTPACAWSSWQPGAQREPSTPATEVHRRAPRRRSRVAVDDVRDGRRGRSSWPAATSVFAGPTDVVYAAARAAGSR